MDNLIDMVDKVLEQSPSKPYAGYNGCFGYKGTPSCTCPKPFLPTPRKVVTVTIEESGNAVFLATDSADAFLEMGKVVTRRASHVEPATFWARQLFRVLRTLVSDTSAVAAWTRTWNVGWRINTKPVGGPILTWAHVAPSKCASWMDEQVFTSHNRQEAIDEEVKFLNEWFAERGI